MIVPSNKAYLLYNDEINGQSVVAFYVDAAGKQSRSEMFNAERRSDAGDENWPNKFLRRNCDSKFQTKFFFIHQNHVFKPREHWSAFFARIIGGHFLLLLYVHCFASRYLLANSVCAACIMNYLSALTPDLFGWLGINLYNTSSLLLVFLQALISTILSIITGSFKVELPACHGVCASFFSGHRIYFSHANTHGKYIFAFCFIHCCFHLQKRQSGLFHFRRRTFYFHWFPIFLSIYRLLFFPAGINSHSSAIQFA